MAANTSPQDIGTTMAPKVSFTTTNLQNGSAFSEPHSVSGPTGAVNIPINAIPIGGNKVVVPVSSSTSAGSYFLKFHLPQPNSSDFYVTFCVKNANYDDGYYDFTQGIPSAMRADLKVWINDTRNFSSLTPTSVTKTLTFNVYGLDTNVVQNSIQYNVRFVYRSNSIVDGEINTDATAATSATNLIPNTTFNP